MGKKQLMQVIQAALFRGIREEKSRIYTLKAPPLDALFGRADKITSIEDVIYNSSSPKKYGESLNRCKRRK